MDHLNFKKQTQNMTTENWVSFLIVCNNGRNVACLYFCDATPYRLYERLGGDTEVIHYKQITMRDLFVKRYGMVNFDIRKFNRICMEVSKLDKIPINYLSKKITNEMQVTDDIIWCHPHGLKKGPLYNEYPIDLSSPSFL